MRFPVSAYGIARIRERPQSRLNRRNLLLVLSASFLIFSMVLLALAQSVFNGVANRDAYRAPITAQGQRAPVGYYLDTFTALPNTVILVQNAGSLNEAPPPGLPSWPTKGQAYLSPHLLSKYALGGPSPWGTVAGSIGPQGLVNLNESFVYANPANFDVSKVGEAVFGWHAPSGFAGDHRSNQPFKIFAILMSLFLVLPAAVFFMTCIRARSDSMKEKFTLLHAMGCSRVTRALLAFLEILPQVLCAMLINVIAILALNSPETINIGFAGVVLQHEDINNALSQLLVVVLLSSVAIFVMCMFSFKKYPQLAATLSPPLRKTRLTPLWLVGLAWVLYIFREYTPTSSVEIMQAVSLLIFILVVCFMPFFAVLFMQFVGKTALHCSLGPRTILFSRSSLQALRAAKVAGFSLVLIFSVICVAQVYGSYYGTLADQGLRVNSQVDKQVLWMRLSSTEGKTYQQIAAELSAALPEQKVALLADSSASEANSDDFLFASCGTWAQLGNHDCRDLPMDVSTNMNGPLRVSAGFIPDKYMSVNEEQINNQKFNGYYIVSIGGNPLPMEQLNALFFDRQFRFFQVGDEWASNAALQLHQVRWVLFFAVPCVTLSVAALGLMLWGELIERLKRMKSLLHMTHDVKTLAALSGASLLLPLISGGTAASITYMFLAHLFTDGFDGVHINMHGIVGLLGYTLLASCFVWLVSIVALRRTMSNLLK